MNTLLQDLVYGFRVLLKRPGFTAIAVFSLALGIGVNTAIFTLINTILLGSLPYPEPNRVIAIRTVPPNHTDQLDYTSVPDFMTWKDQSQSFEALGSMYQNVRYFGAEENGAPAERIEGEDLTPQVLLALGVQPFMGRLFQMSEDEVDHPSAVVILSYRLWQTRFGGDKNILNRTVVLDGIKTEIIGVMPSDFRLTSDNAGYWAPMRFTRFQLRGSPRILVVIGRLKRGVSMPQAQAEMESIAGKLAKEFPDRDADHGKAWGVRVQPIRTELFGFMTRPLLLLQGAVGFVLLIACANVAALLLARASGRHNEVAIRSALGASRGRIIRQFLTESMLLSIIGGAFGVLLASWGVRALVAFGPSQFPRLHDTAMDARVLWFSAAVSVLTGLIFGVGPAMQGAKSSFVEALKDSARGGTSGVLRNRLRGALVMVQIAMALILLIGAGLLIRSFVKVQGVGLGFDPSGLLTFSIRFPPNQFAKPAGMYRGLPLWEVNAVPADTIRRIFERVQSVPGVQSASGTLVPLLTESLLLPFRIEGQAVQDADALSAAFYPITPNYFNTMKIAMLRGRDFSARDTVNAPWVAIINETMARRYWPHEDPIGKSIKMDLSPQERAREVIAVVHDTPSTRLQNKQDPAIYVPYVQMPQPILASYRGFLQQMTFVLRTQGEPMSMLPTMQHAVAEVDPNRPLIEPKTVEQSMSKEVEYPRYYSLLLGLFALVAMTLAAVGIYGVMSYAVAQRTREIGIRMALGASKQEILNLVVRQGLLLVLGGLVLGLSGGAVLTRFISSQLWEVTATDPATFVAVSAVMIAVAMAACLVPTLRAIRVDPTVALRYE